MPPVSKAAYESSRAAYEATMAEYRAGKQRASAAAPRAPRPTAGATSSPSQSPGRLFLVARRGPTCFTVADSLSRSFTVTLGARHTCTCRGGAGCAHVRWVLSRCLGLNARSAACGGLPEASLARALEASLRGGASSRPRARRDGAPPPTTRPPLHADSVAWLLALGGEDAALLAQPTLEEPDEAGAAGGSARRRPVEPGEACPVCMEEMPSDATGGAPDGTLVCCRGSCGRSLHRECLAIWAKHQAGAPTCPMCRAAWGEVDVRSAAELEAEAARRARQRELRETLDAIALREALSEVARRRERAGAAAPDGGAAPPPPPPPAAAAAAAAAAARPLRPGAGNAAVPQPRRAAAPPAILRGPPAAARRGSST